jgi:hypothetical protein
MSAKNSTQRRKGVQGEHDAIRDAKLAALKYQINPNVLDLIWMVRLIHKQKVGAGKLDFTCDARIVSDHRKLARLLETLGTLAERLRENDRSQKRNSELEAWNLRQDLAYLAAHIIAWLELIEEISPFDKKEAI